MAMLSFEPQQQKSGQSLRLPDLIVTTEAFYDPIKDLLGLSSKKGAQYKPVEQKHTYNNKALVTAIMRQYGNPGWLNQQNWVYTSVKAGDILPYLVQGVAKPHPDQALEVANRFYLEVYANWHKGMQAYCKAVQPAVKALGKGLTDEALKAAEEALAAVKNPETYFKSPPKAFPVMSRPLPKKHEKLRAVDSLREPTKLRPLKKEEVVGLVKVIVQTLEAAEKLREQMLADAEASLKVEGSNKLYQLAHSKNAVVPKGSEASLARWKEVALRLDPTTIYWSSGPFTTTRTCYSDLVLAITKWIDRSLK